jgi:hypothetical protein
MSTYQIIEIRLFEIDLHSYGYCIINHNSQDMGNTYNGTLFRCKEGNPEICHHRRKLKDIILRGISHSNKHSV